MAIYIEGNPANIYDQFANEQIQLDWKATTDSYKEIAAPEGDLIGEGEVVPLDAPEISDEQEAEREYAEIISVSVELDIEIPKHKLRHVQVNDGKTTCSITGYFLIEELFDETKYTYVDRGESNKTQSPTTTRVVESFDNEPIDIELFSLVGDPRNAIVGTVTVTAENSFGETASEAYEYTVLNNYDRSIEYLDRVHS